MRTKTPNYYNTHEYKIRKWTEMVVADTHKFRNTNTRVMIIFAEKAKSRRRKKSEQ